MGTEKKNQVNSAFHLDREEEKAEESDDSNLSDAGADCRDRMLMEWADQDFCWCQMEQEQEYVKWI